VIRSILLLAGMLTARCLTIAGDAPARFDPSQSDPAAIRLADQVMEGLGGSAAWDKTRYIRFSFDVVEGGKTVAHRVHLWDRFQGRLRYEKADKDGTPLIVLLALDRRDGNVWRGGRQLDPTSAKPWLQEAYEDELYRLHVGRRRTCAAVEVAIPTVDDRDRMAARGCKRCSQRGLPAAIQRSGPKCG